MSSRGAVFLDRDGVINQAIVLDGKKCSPMRLDELVLLPGVPEACRTLAAAGHPLVVVTNQPEVSRGRLAASVLDAMHDVLRARLPLVEVVHCPHEDADACSCRKPKPGMIIDACARLDLDPSKSVMVGDQWKDIAAGTAAGCATVHIGHDYADADTWPPDGRADSLDDATELILGLMRGRRS